MSVEKNEDVYTYRGNEGEIVSEWAESLVVDSAVKALPNHLCYNYKNLRKVTLQNGLTSIGSLAFNWCAKLLEITICNTVQHIGDAAFQNCKLLTKVEFQDSESSSPNQLTTIEKEAFRDCTHLSRIKLPASLNVVGVCTFAGCCYMVEANLSTTGVIKISERTFHNCNGLKTVSLPKTLEQIDVEAFYSCWELATVVVPLDSRPIKIGKKSFYDCRVLANLVLPKDSTAEEDSFSCCELLHEHYDDDSSRILASLIGRFEKFPIHGMCYDHSIVSVQDLRQCIADHQEECSILDTFEMTPFHVFFLTPEPRLEVLEVLLELLPTKILRWTDVNGMSPLGYLIGNWTDGTKSLFERTLEKWMIDRVACWGATSWREEMHRHLQETLVQGDSGERITLYNEACFALEYYEIVASMSFLEMALWKEKLKSGWTSDGIKRQTLDRNSCRSLNGADVVIPNVLKFLEIPR